MTVAERGIGGLYKGCSALVVGNAVKAGVRFLSYDYFKGLLHDSEVRSKLGRELLDLQSRAC
jgi:solute carrier family 25 citrate transporter 1